MKEKNFQKLAGIFPAITYVGHKFLQNLLASIQPKNTKKKRLMIVYILYYYYLKLNFVLCIMNPPYKHNMYKLLIIRNGIKDVFLKK
jgi:hypothetical protein